jgi:hypothetical protein
VWLYHCFPLSCREVEELMFTRGVVVSYQMVRQWSVKFGPDYARELRRRLSAPGYRTERRRRFTVWNQITASPASPNAATSSTVCSPGRKVLVSGSGGGVGFGSAEGHSEARCGAGTPRS